jgi:hypothetical protein
MKPRPTTYCGIQMRSRLEAQFAAYLDNVGFEWTYEPRAYASRSGVYLPDFEVDVRGMAPMFVEVKPDVSDLETIEKALERITVIWESIPDATLAVAFGNSSVAIVAKGRSSRWDYVEWAEWGQRAA